VAKAWPKSSVVGARPSKIGDNAPNANTSPPAVATSATGIAALMYLPNHFSNGFVPNPIADVTAPNVAHLEKAAIVSALTSHLLFFILLSNT